MTDLTFFLVRADFILLAAIITALTLTEFSSADGIDPGEVSFSPLAGVNQITP